MDYFSGSVSESLLVAPFVLSLVVVLPLTGCQGTDNSKLKRLDRQQGIGGLALGDSLYGRIFRSHREQAADDDPIETTVRGHVFTAGMRVDLGERFLFGVDRGRVSADALDGQIYSYMILNPDIPSSRVQALEDSLVATFGPPTHVLDSVYVAALFTKLPVSPAMSKADVLEMATEKDLVPASARIDSTAPASIRRWQGQNVTMQFSALEQGFLLDIYDRKTAGTLLSLQQDIDSMLKAGTVRSFKHVGEFPLLTTKQNSLLRTKESSYSDQLEYEVPYKSLKPFFGVENRGSIGSQAIEASPEFSPTTDSLSQLTVTMDESVYDADSYGDEVFLTIGKVREVLQPSLGNPALTTTTTTLEGEFDTLYWPGSPFSVIAREERIIDKISVTFDRTGRVGFNLHRRYRENDWNLPPIFYLPWPDRD